MRKPFATAVAVLLALPLAAGACKKKDASAAGDGGSDEAGADSKTAAAGDTLGTGFEGELSMHVTSAHKPAGEDITFLSKGGKLRFDAPGRHGETSHVVFEGGGTRKMLIVMDTQKAYMEMEVPTGAVHNAAAPHAPSGEATVTKTGKHEKVAGYDCEDWEIKEPSGKRADACIAAGIPFIDFANIGPGAQGAGSAWMQEFHEKLLFPLRVVELDTAGKETSRMEVTKIDKKKLDDALFAIPAGYKKLEIPSFGAGGFPGAPGIPGPPGGFRPPTHK